MKGFRDINGLEIIENSFDVNLSANERKFITTKAESLMERSPSDSTIRIIFSRIGSQITCKLFVQGLSSRFYSEKISSNSLNAFDSALEDIDDQLLMWKSTRFAAPLVNKSNLEKDFA